MRIALQFEKGSYGLRQLHVADSRENGFNQGEFSIFITVIEAMLKGSNLINGRPLNGIMETGLIAKVWDNTRCILHVPDFAKVARDLTEKHGDEINSWYMQLGLPIEDIQENNLLADYHIAKQYDGWSLSKIPDNHRKAIEHLTIAYGKTMQHYLTSKFCGTEFTLLENMEPIYAQRPVFKPQHAFDAEDSFDRLRPVNYVWDNMAGLS